MSSKLKFDGNLTLEERETKKDHVVPVKLYEEESTRHTLIIFNFKKNKLDLINPALSIMISNFKLDPFALDVLGYQGSPGDKNKKSWLVRFEWVDQSAQIIALEEIKRNEDSDAG